MSETDTLFGVLRQSADEDVVDVLERMVLDAPDHALNRMNALELAAKAGLGEERTAQRTYLDQRIRAERLRALAFAYLAELPPFTGAEREARLIGAVADVREGREPA